MESAQNVLSQIKIGAKPDVSTLISRDCVRNSDTLQRNFQAARRGDETALRSLVAALSGNYIVYKDGVLFKNDIARYNVMASAIVEIISTGKFDNRVDILEWALAYLLQSFYDMDDSIVSKEQKAKVISMIEGYFAQ